MDVRKGMRCRRAVPLLVLATGVFGGACTDERADRRVAERDARETAAVSAQIDTLLVAEAGDLRGSLRRHQQTVRAMLASFDADMRALHLDDHPEWTSRLEELQNQIRLIEDMSVDELHAFLPAYRARVAALVRLHASLRRSP